MYNDTEYVHTCIAKSSKPQAKINIVADAVVDVVDAGVLMLLHMQVGSVAVVAAVVFLIVLRC